MTNVGLNRVVELGALRRAMSDLSIPERFYVAGAAALGLGIAIAMFSAGSPNQAANLMVWTCGLIWSGTLAYEAYQLIVKFAASRLVKWMAIPVLGMGSAAALGQSAYLINEATGQDPNFFPRALAFMTPIAALPLVGLLAVVLLIVSLFVTPLFGMQQICSVDPLRSKKAWIWMPRFFALVASLILVLSAFDADSGLDATSKQWAARVVEALDMHTDPECGGSEGARVKRISDALVVRATEANGEAVFKRYSCVLGPQI